MKYAKMTLAGFLEKLKAGQYAGVAGARRALGKATDFSAKDMSAAQSAVDSAFPKTEGSEPAERVSAVPAKRGRRAAAQAPKAAQPAKRGPRRADRAAVAAGTTTVRETLGDDRKIWVPPPPPEIGADFAVPQRHPITSGHQQPVAASYYNAACALITSYKGASPLSPREQHAYDIAVETTISCADEEARTRVDGRVAPTASRTKANGYVIGEPLKAAPPRTHIAVPHATTAPATLINELANPMVSSLPDMSEKHDVDLSNAPAEVREGVKRLNEAAASMPELGPRVPINATS